MFNAKKLAAFFLIGGIVMGAATADTLVAYFSATGTTARLARTIASALNADLFEIEPAVPYTSTDLNWRDRSTRATVECNDPASRPAIAKTTDISRYDTVVIAFPIWWYDAPKIIYTFVESYDLSGKRIVPVCTSGGSGLGRTVEHLSAIASPSARWISGTRFNANASSSEVKSFFDGALK